MSVAVLTAPQTHAEARSTAARWRVVLGSVLVLHGLAHANVVIWAFGGAPLWRGAMRVTFWGALAMICTAIVGRIFGTTIS